jgi:hypothetical protein
MVLHLSGVLLKRKLLQSRYTGYTRTGCFCPPQSLICTYVAATNMHSSIMAVPSGHIAKQHGNDSAACRKEHLAKPRQRNHRRARGNP